MANFKDSKYFEVHDDYYTRPSTLDMIIPYIPKDKVIWEPFLLNSNEQSKKYLQSKGFNVVGDNTINFFNHDLGEVLVGNPPFETEIKKRILKRLVELDKPFILIMPTSKLNTSYIRENFKDSDDKLQIIIPRKRIQFIKNGNELQNKCNFDCFYYCYKCNLERDIIWLD